MKLDQGECSGAIQDGQGVCMKDGFVVAGCMGSGHCNFVLHGVTDPHSRYLVEGGAYFLSVEG